MAAPRNINIAPDVYRYLAHDWGLATNSLTPHKCALLRNEIRSLRHRYQENREIPYHKPSIRRAYLAAFAPRYAYVLFRCLSRRRTKALQILRAWHRQEGVVCLMGGGPACELVGLLDWLYSKEIEPRFLRVIMLDREHYWRTFHNFLFSDILGRNFRKTLVVPTYESVSFPVKSGTNFDRTAVSYNFAQIAELAEARLICINNCLSELSDHRGFQHHLRFLTRLAFNPQMIICADSAAKKRRPRMSWLNDGEAFGATFPTNVVMSETVRMRFPHLTRDAVTNQIFPSSGAPHWLNTIARQVYIHSKT